MGRKPWSDRLAVEECLALRVSDLRRAGVFATASGSFVLLTAPGLRFTVQTGGDPPRLLLVRCRPAEPAGAPVALSCLLRLAATRPHFGGVRRWFLCPGCGRRTGILFLVPGLPGFVCRLCGDLAYRSSQNHNKSVDRLARLSDEEFLCAFPRNNPKRALLWVRASAQRLRRGLRDANP